MNQSSWSVVQTIRTMKRSQGAAAVLARRNIFSGTGGNQNGGGRKDGGNHSGYRPYVSRVAAAAAAASVAAYYASQHPHHAKMTLLAESGEAELTQKENRVRAYAIPDKIFNYFASYQLVSKGGKKTMMMTPLEFYAAITPDCQLVHGVGSGVYVEVTEEEIQSGKVSMEKSPVQGSVLNAIGELGLLSYADFSFLLCLLSTPKRYVETAFNIFDVTGDGEVEAKEFAYVSTNMAQKEGGFGSYTDVDQEQVLASHSGLLNYLFGVNRNKALTKDKFKKLQADLLDEIIQLEFREYDKGNTGRIRETDFVNFLLKGAKITPKKKAAMLKKINTMFPATSQHRGISLPSFRSFFHVLAGSEELERALFFLDVEGIGVDAEEFRKISSWVSGLETSDHVVKVLFAILDEDKDGRLFRDDLAGVLLDWRHARGYDKGSLKVTLGQIRI